MGIGESAAKDSRGLLIDIWKNRRKIWKCCRLVVSQIQCCWFDLTYWDEWCRVLCHDISYLRCRFYNLLKSFSLFFLSFGNTLNNFMCRLKAILMLSFF